MDFIAPMLVLIIGCLTIGSIFRTQIVNRRLRENTRAWADLQGKLIDKFGSADEVVRYLESDRGKQLLDNQATNAASPHSRILDSVHTGVLVLLGGVGLIAASGSINQRVNETLIAFGTIAVLLGAGFLVSAGISWMLLRNWGLLGKSAAQDSTSEQE
jgi:hypothetical protein